MTKIFNFFDFFKFGLDIPLLISLLISNILISVVNFFNKQVDILNIEISSLAIILKLSIN